MHECLGACTHADEPRLRKTISSCPAGEHPLTAFH